MNKVINVIWNLFMIYEEPMQSKYDFQHYPGGWFLRKWACWTFVIGVALTLFYLLHITQPA